VLEDIEDAGAHDPAERGDSRRFAAIRGDRGDRDQLIQRLDIQAVPAQPARGDDATEQEAERDRDAVPGQRDGTEVDLGIDPIVMTAIMCLTVHWVLRRCDGCVRGATRPKCGAARVPGQPLWPASCCAPPVIWPSAPRC